MASSWKPRLALRLSGRPLMPETPRCMNRVGAATASNRAAPSTRLSAGRRMMTAAVRAHQLLRAFTGRAAPVTAGAAPATEGIGAPLRSAGRRPGHLTRSMFTLSPSSRRVAGSRVSAAATAAMTTVMAPTPRLVNTE